MDKSLRVTSPALSLAQAWSDVELHFVGAAAGTKAGLIVGQRVAGAKVHLLTGNGSANLLSAAEAAVLVVGNSGQPSAAQTAIAAKLVTYGTAVPTQADGARCVAFAIGGLGGLGAVLRVELEHIPAPAASVAATVLRTVVSGPATVKASGDTLVYGTDNLVFFPEADVLVGNFQLAESDNAPVAGAQICLKVTIRL